jgi:folate-binding protein YgfZ
VTAKANLAEFQALQTGAALIDRSALGRLWITGADALDLLNRLTTNKLDELPEGIGRSTVVTNGDARIIAFIALGAIGGGMYCLTSPGRGQPVIDWLDSYTFGEEITVEDRTTQTGHFAVAGPHAVEVMTRLPGVGSLGIDALANVDIGTAKAVVWRSLVGGVDGYEVIVESASAALIRGSLAAAGASPVSEETWEAFRVANGVPAFGSELGDFTNPLEGRLMGAISEDKGCYIGQEVIARLLTYKKVQRRLMSVKLSAPVDVGADLLGGENRVGTITSVAETPEGHIALALVSSKHAQSGSELRIGSASAKLADPLYATATEPSE